MLDLPTWSVVGYALSTSPNAELAIAALNNTIKRQQPVLYKLMFHSAQGCQDSTASFRTLLSQLTIAQSMSRPGNCWDNAVMERFFRSFKTEWMPKIGYGNFIDAKYSISGYINGYYNNVRSHHYNAGLASNESEVRYKDSKTVAKLY